MTESITYYGTFTDDFGTTDICILNDFDNLYFEIDEKDNIVGMKYYDYHGIDNDTFKKTDEYTSGNVPKIFLGASLKDK